ncbi:tight junction protein ZO-1 isoform X1 [Cotesia glomerata]|uniref:tight junction protein ZO-1 isoform X1 n=2 Tax=Cotesia glomerata TaxID=32391 RepID=UPI001D0121C7|nr:tight junction protein ZO-1 isoform X1 [Cotesia glomerata]
MAGSLEIKILLSRHKSSLLQELNSTDLLSVLVKRGVITDVDKDAVAGNPEQTVNADIDLFIDIIGAKGFDAFREFCFALEAECPHVLTDLLVDQHSVTGEYQPNENKEPKEETKNEEKDSRENSLVIVEDEDTKNPDIIYDDEDSSKDCLDGDPERWSGPEEILDEPVDEPVGDRGWEVHHVTVTRVPGYGFGIAVSGGRDNPHFTNGDPAIAISDVLKAGPAEGKLQVNDRIISANGVSLEGADYGAAVRVLRDSGSTVLLVVKRRAVTSMAPPAQPQTHRLTLTRNNKKDDFGLVLGCRLYVKEVTRENGAKPGDLLTRIGGVAADNMSLKEAKKIMDSCKDRLSVVVTREPGASSSSAAAANYSTAKEAGEYLSGASYSSQNLYVPPPTRQPEDKSNLAPRGGRSRGPLMDVSLSQLDLPATPTVDPPRPPPPRPEDYYSSRRQLYEEEQLRVSSKQQPVPDPRFITFQKEGSVGVRLSGGNETGVFVTAVQPGSPASLQGLQPGDKILKVNDMDMKGVTREEAVLFLLSLQEQIDLIVQHRRQEYDQIVNSGRGDSFHIKTHFHYEQPDKGEMSFRSGDVFHVIDTLHNGVVGAWQVFRIGRNNQEVQKGIIPNKARAEELATAQFNATKKELSSSSESRGSFFRRRRGSHRRSKSLGRDHWDDVVFADSISKFPAYERVVLRHPGFIRPVVLFGPVADLAREKLLKDFPDKFTSPQMENQLEDSAKGKTNGIIRLSAIREVMERSKHALLDITPNAVDRLNYAQFYPIVIFLKAENKQVIKEMRAGIPKSAHKSSKKLLEQCQKLDKIWGHTFSAVITLTTPEAWYRKLRELIDRQQQGPLWMSQTKPEEALSDDFLFPMTSRLSYASSPESDLELNTNVPLLSGQLGPPTRLKSSSDPSIATQDDTAAPPPYTSSYQAFEQHKRAVPDNKYGFSPSGEPNLPSYTPGVPSARSPHHGPPDLPPRVDRNAKPPGRGTLGRSAVDRLVNKTDSVLDMRNYINATPHRANATSSLERSQPKPVAGSYDSMSSYDSYNTNGNQVYNVGPNLNTSTGRLGPNVPDDLKTGNIPQRAHDPYRFTRSTAQPTGSQENRGDYAKYSRPEHKVIPTTPSKGNSNTGTYKPVPPPKPKNYRPPVQSTVPDENNPGNLYQHAKNYSLTPSHVHNGIENNGNHRNSGQYYYNIPPPNRGQDGNFLINTNNHNHSHSLSHSHSHSNPPVASHAHSNSAGQLTLNHSHSRSNVNNANNVSNNSNNNVNNAVNGHAHNGGHNREPSGLDLAGSREQRGSAFELYRKPPIHHNVRTSGITKGLFNNEGGILRGPGDVVMTIPPGAIPTINHQEIYFAVVPPVNNTINNNQNDIYYDFDNLDINDINIKQRGSISPPVNKGESLMSPLIECGPRGMKFNKPIELRIPHNGTPKHKLILKTANNEDLDNSWSDIKLPKASGEYIFVKLDHF